jgi:tripartite-type tricarboxylate transporter receptor subunit TctC
MAMRRRAAIVGAASSVLAAASGRAAGYPDHPVRLVVPFPPGGPTDVFARVLSGRLSEELGQQVVVENKAGAGGNVGTESVATARPDGYTLLFGTAATHGINVSLYQKLPYDPVRDFEAIAVVGTVPMAFVVHPSMPHSALELIAKLRAEPGKWSYGSSGNGTTNHLAGEMLKKRFGLDVQHVPYRGTAPASQDLLAGRLAFMFESFSTTAELVRSGRLVALGVMANKRSVAAPDVPTMAEAGVPDFVGGTWNVVVAPAGTPREIVDRLNVAVNKTIVHPPVAARLSGLGIDAITDSTPASTLAFIQAEIVKWRELVIFAGAKVD